MDQLFIRQKKNKLWLTIFFNFSKEPTRVGSLLVGITFYHPQNNMEKKSLHKLFQTIVRII